MFLSGEDTLLAKNGVVTILLGMLLIFLLLFCHIPREENKSAHAITDLIS